MADQHKIILDRGVEGDQVVAKISKAGQKTSLARVTEITELSIHRTENELCENFICSGCAFKAAEYSYQTAWKKEQLRELFNFEADYTPSQELHYRHKIILPLGFDLKKNHYIAGLYLKNSHAITNWRQPCTVCLPQISQLQNEIVAALNNQHQQSGNVLPVSQLFIRGSKDDGFQCGIVFKEESEQIAPFCTSLAETIKGINSCFYEINSNNSNSVVIKQPVFVTKEQTVGLKIQDKDYQLGPESFFQANLFTTEQIIGKMQAAVEELVQPLVYDICSGVGVLSAGLKHYSHRYCFEYNAEAFKYIPQADLTNSSFIQADMATLELSSYPHPNVIILDPPRKGVDSRLLEKINVSKAAIILYLSCNPVTQKRDLALLGNYQLKELTGFDMFPQTPHIESLAVLSLKI